MSDVGSATIRAFGILNTVAEQALGSRKDDPTFSDTVKTYVSAASVTELNRGIPFPGTFVVDRQGTVISRFFEDAYRERNTAASILLSLGDGPAPVDGTKLTTRHLDVTTYPSDSTIAPGDRISLAVHVTPHPRIHVYAPGASGYKVVGVTIDPQPFVRVLPRTFPPSQIYVFKPLKERVRVYQRPFTLLQDVVLEASADAQTALKGKTSLALTGSLQYQACDDRICFNPVSLPLSWTVALRGLDTERVKRP